MTGLVKRLINERGFGFILGPSGISYFFHATSMAAGATFDALKVGDAVMFEAGHDPKGPRAHNVTTQKQEGTATT